MTDTNLNERVPVTQAGRSWRCFHCDEVFVSAECARLHFGRDEDSTPACKIKGGAEQGLLGALRAAEYEASDARRAIADECTEAARAHYTQAARHDRALRNAEEAGYERGLADGRIASEQSQAACITVLEGADIDMRPNLGFPTDEPSLSQIVLQYYLRHFPLEKASSFRDRYFAALSHPAPSSSPVIQVTDAEVERAADAILANIRDRRLLKWLFAENADSRPGPVGYVDGPIDLETQWECVSTWAKLAFAALTNAKKGEGA